MDELNRLVHGALILACAVVALFFLRFWRDTRDRLFLFFASAFGVMAIQWTVLALTTPAHEHRPLFYVLRLAAFVLIIVAVLDKNRASR